MDTLNRAHHLHAATWSRGKQEARKKCANANVLLILRGCVSAMHLTHTYTHSLCLARSRARSFSRSRSRSRSLSLSRARARALSHGFCTVTCVLARQRGVENTLFREHTLQRTHSIKITLYNAPGSNSRSRKAARR